MGPLSWLFTNGRVLRRLQPHDMPMLHRILLSPWQVVEDVWEQSCRDFLVMSTRGPMRRIRIPRNFFFPAMFGFGFLVF